MQKLSVDHLFIETSLMFKVILIPGKYVHAKKNKKKPFLIF